MIVYQKEPLCEQHVPAVLDIWLEASTKAHDFMPRSFWESNLEAMRDVYLPMAETTLCMADGKVVGFLSMVEETIACLFAEPSWQGKGAGRFLMDVAKASQTRLTLSVYKENEQARRFYEQSGFRTTLEQQDAHTGHPELVMEWAAN